MILLCLTLSVLGVLAQDQVVQPTVPGKSVKYPDDYCANIKSDEQFDIIVVGAGPAGSAVARRLSEVPSLRVLLIEAGGDPTPTSDIPGNAVSLGLDLRWNFTTTRSPTSCQGTILGRCGYLPGKVLGGSSVVNYMMYARGNHKDFDEWEALGNPGWGYKDVLPYFKKMENYLAQQIGSTETNDTVSSEYHQRGGPLTSAYFPIDQKTHEAREAILQAAADNGFKYNPDVNGEDQLGFTNLPGMVDTAGYRQNTAKAYLLHIPDNLKVCKNAIVNKVIFQDKTATGVEVLYPVNGLINIFPRRFKIQASKEVILSAGPFNSPPILERSGIGQASVLRRAGVPVLVERPGVGENLQDHFINLGSAFTIDYQTEAALNPMSNELTSLTGFMNITDPSNPAPDMQFILRNFEPLIALGLQFSPSAALQFTTTYAKSDILFFGDIVLRQGKHGSIHILQSLDPRITPEITTNQLTTDYDTRITVAATRLARKIMSHPALSRFNPEPFILRECRRFPFNSDQEIMCMASHMANSLYHLAGPCSMGGDNNPNSVVDSRLRVIGVKNLRVIDSSIMPLVTRANTEIPTVMIGEKGADLVKEDLGLLGQGATSSGGGGQGSTGGQGTNAGGSPTETATTAPRRSLLAKRMSALSEFLWGG